MSNKVKISSWLTKEEKTILDKLTKKLKLTQGALIGNLLRSYKQLSPKGLGLASYESCSWGKPPRPHFRASRHNDDSVISVEKFALSDIEQREVEKALTNSNSSLDEVAKDGLLQRSRYLNSIAERQAQLESMSESELNKATFKGAANYRIEQAIEMIMNHNNNQSEKSRKVCITKGMIFKLTGSNRQTINKYVDEHNITISDHNHKHSLTTGDNNKGKGFSFEQLLGVE